MIVCGGLQATPSNTSRQQISPLRRSRPTGMSSAACPAVSGGVAGPFSSGQFAASEIVCDLAVVESPPTDSSSFGGGIERHSVVTSGIDPRLDSHLREMLRLVKARELDLFFSPCFKSITRNPKKLLSIIDHVLRHGGTVLTPNYLLSPSYLARRAPLLRPIHYNSELDAQLNDVTGLTERHRNALALLAR